MKLKTKERVDNVPKVASRRKAAVSYGEKVAQRYKQKCMK